MKKLVLIFIMLGLLFVGSPLLASGPFFYMGDGQIQIGRGYNGTLKNIRFRNKDGSYDTSKLRLINQIYGSDYERPEARMSLRLIELLDFLEDKFKGNGIQIISGYRSPTHNQSLRNKGKLAASSSLHLDAEATDIVMGGVKSSVINQYLLTKNCCGVGYYHGKTIHIDTGPPRFWDKKTSGTEKKEPPQNEYIALKTKSDIYNPGQKVGLKFSRVNEYPIGVKARMELVCGEKEKKHPLTLSLPGLSNVEGSKGKAQNGCVKLQNRAEGRKITLVLPEKAPKNSKNYQECHILAHFCPPITEKMPKFVKSNPFWVKR